MLADTEEELYIYKQLLYMQICISSGLIYMYMYADVYTNLIWSVKFNSPIVYTCIKSYKISKNDSKYHKAGLSVRVGTRRYFYTS